MEDENPYRNPFFGIATALLATFGGLGGALLYMQWQDPHVFDDAKTELCAKQPTLPGAHPVAKVASRTECAP